MFGAVRTAVKPRARQGFRVGFLVLVLFGTFTLLSFAGAGGVLRPLFPAASVLTGAWLLANGRREDYVALTLWMFLLTPGLRRVVDLHAGWSQVNVLMLAPYAVASLSIAPILTMLAARRFGYSMLFMVVFVCVGYGLVLAAINNRFFAAIFDALRWGLPPCFGLLIALDPERRLGYQQSVTRTLMLALIALSLYAICQFLVMPRWDALWMQESGMASIGKPEPYLVRVFSTLNSPGSFASYLVAGLLLVLPSASSLRLPAVGLGMVALLLSLVRTSWLGLGVGFVFLVLFGASVRARLSILAAVICLPIALLGVEQIPRGAAIIDARLQTFTSVQSDESFVDRSAGYREFFYSDLPEAPFGSGLGVNGAYQSYMDQRAARLVDGAVIEIGMALGAFAGGAYLLAILTTAFAACYASCRSGDAFISSCGAVVAAQTVGLVGGNMAVGEVGMLFWIAAAFCLMPVTRFVPALPGRAPSGGPLAARPSS